jgi:hypothetical protein
MDHGPVCYEDHGDATARVKAACLDLATVLGNLLDSITVVGGLVPSLLIPEGDPAEGFEPHPGTIDLDLGLSLAILDTQLYTEIARQLRGAGYHPALSPTGNERLQQWQVPGSEVTIDFLIPRTTAGEQDGRVKPLEHDLGAVITPGLELVERDYEIITLEGTTLHGSQARRDIRVCGVGAYVVLKARAIHLRAKAKDAFDLHYILRNYGTGLREVASALHPLLDNESAEEAIRWLADDFATVDDIGPARVARFRYAAPNPRLQSDAQGLVRELLRLLR